MQKFRLTILLIICSNGLAYAQTFNETPILPFMPQKEMKFPKISGLPDIKEYSVRNESGFQQQPAISRTI